MFKGLFKSGWKSDSVEKRLHFIEGIDVSVAANQKILEKLAANDIDTSVRHAAMKKITDPQAVFNLWQTNCDNDDNAVSDEKNNSSQLAESTFRHLIQSSDFSEADFKTFLANNPKSNMIIAKYCPINEIRDEILVDLNESDKAEIISDIPYSMTRVMLAETLHSIDSLEVARKNLKGKDKSAEKIIKAKIDTYHAKQKLELENAATAKSLRENMEALDRYVAWSDEIKVKFFSLSKSWDKLDFEPCEDERNRYAKAFANVEADVKHHMAINLSQQSQEKIVSSLELLCEKISAYSLEKMLSESTIINDQLSELSWQLEKEAETIPYTSSVQERYIRSSKAIQSAIKICETVRDSRAEKNSEDSFDQAKVIKGNSTEDDVSNSDEENQNKNRSEKTSVNTNGIASNSKVSTAKAILQATNNAAKHSAWSKDYPALECANEAISEANAILNINSEALKEAKDSLDNLHKKINRIFGAAKRGDIGRAQRDLASVAKAASHYQGSERKRLDDRIEEVSADVSKMGDWKDFAIEPKLIDLCEQMEALPELERQSKNPSANSLAKKIKTLQDSWKAMGTSDISDTYWPRFKEAGDKAYEPCAEFFKQRQIIQRENLEKREPLISKMKELLEETDWNAKPDFKVIEDSVSQIMQSWKKIKDVEHGRGQKQWENLAKIKDQINEKLDAEYDKNIAVKQNLTAQFEQMLEEDVSEQSLDKLKFIQSKWKQVGVTRRKQDQAAWLKFKAASDAVYEKIQGLRQEKRAIEDEQIDAYKQIHTLIHQLAKSTEDLTVSDKEFEALESQYKALPALPTALPEKLIERLEHDYAKACDAYGNAHERLNKAKLDKELDTLSSKAQFCSKLEQLSESAEQSEIEELQEKINSLELVNKDYIKRFAVRIKKARDIDRESYSNARRLLLIESEILLDIESPKVDKDLRLQIQLEKMKQQGIGNAIINKTAAINELKVEWLCLPGAEAKLQSEFDKRFDKLLQLSS